MSIEAKDSRVLTSEQDTEVEQKSSQLSNEESGVEVLAVVNLSQVNAEVGADNSSSSNAYFPSDEVVILDETNHHQSSHKDTVTIGDGNMQDSQKSLFFDGGKGMALQQRGKVDGGSSSKLQQGDSIAGTEIQVGSGRDGTESQHSGASVGMEPQQGGASLGTEPQQGGASLGTEPQQGYVCLDAESQQGGASLGTEFQQGGATGGVSRDPSQENASSVDNSCTKLLQSRVSFTNSKFPFVVVDPLRLDLNNSSTEYSQDVSAASRRPSLVSGTGRDISSCPDFQDSVSTVGSSTGDSQETAVVGDLSNQNSFESGVAGDISNSPRESPPNSSESWEGMAAPSELARLQESSSERGQGAEDLPRSYDQRFCNCSFICDILRRISGLILKSEIFTGIRTVLLLVAIFVVSVGMGHLDSCPAKSELPILVMLLGVVGLVVLLFSSVMNGRLDCPTIYVCLLRAAMIIARLTFLGLYGAVVYFTYTMSPSFDSEDNNFCDKGFYYMTYFANIFIGCVIVAAFFIYIPLFNEDDILYQQI